MSKLRRYWSWFLPGLICLCPMGALAYYNAGLEHEVLDFESTRARRRALVSESHSRTAVILRARP
ncbi:MAG: hypothetical protein M3082_00535 [Candidatus Dormibacteraeota bacterium]|nr:hypothetical protein [Candidatus Dormibacteraeota bacterium]